MERRSNQGVERLCPYARRLKKKGGVISEKRTVRAMLNNQGIFVNLKNQRGTVIILVAVTVTFLLSLVAFAVDLGMAYMARTELNNLASLTALAAIKSYTSSATAGGPTDFKEQKKQVKNAADVFISKFPDIKGGKAPIALADGDIELGYYGYNSASPAYYKKFTPDPRMTDENASSSLPVNAVRVNLAASIKTVFAPLIGIAQIDITTQAAAAAGIRHILIALDISNSMDDWAYVPTPPPGALPPYDKTYDVYPARAFHLELLADTSVPFPAMFQTFNAVYKMGGLPDPMSQVFDLAKNSLLTNPLFSGFYRVSLVVYNSDPTIRVSFPTDGGVNNKDQVEAEIDLAKGYWQALIDSDMSDAAYAPYIPFKLGPNTPAGNPHIFPGGTDPTGSKTGRPSIYTNIGATIRTAVTEISKASTTTNTQAVDMIILLSDGVPTCYDAGGGTTKCNAAAVWRTDCINFALNEAGKAGAANIAIHAIFFGNAGDPGWTTMQQIANKTSAAGGKAYLATDLSALEETFKKLNQQPAVVLAPLS